MSTLATHNLTRKQLQRLESFEASEREIRVTGWHETYNGPIVTFFTDSGKSTVAVTRDGGVQPLTSWH